VTLGDAQISNVVSIQRVGGERSFRRRLMELGLVPGTQVTLVAVAPLGDPLKLRVRGCDLSIRRREAQAIEVELRDSSEAARAESVLTESPV
jgi:Fe2+ transport system protein FeoA